MHVRNKMGRYYTEKDEISLPILEMSLIYLLPDGACAKLNQAFPRGTNIEVLTRTAIKFDLYDLHYDFIHETLNGK